MRSRRQDLLKNRYHKVYDDNGYVVYGGGGSE